jgi:hypothetical protein
MAIMRTWKCAAHGEFMAYVGKCPSGCGAGMVTQMYGASVHTSGKTKFIDKTLKDMSKEYGMTDFNNRGGQNGFEEADRKLTTQQKRMMGQSYSVPIDHPVDSDGKPIDNMSSVIGSMGVSSDSNIAATMKQEGRLEFKANVVRDDGVRIQPKDIKP